MSQSLLAKTTFQTGPDDSLRVVDVYGEQASGVINSYQAKDSEAIDVLDALNGKQDEKQDPQNDQDNPGDSDSSPDSDAPADDPSDPQSDPGSGDSGNGSGGSSSDNGPFDSVNPDFSGGQNDPSDLQDRFSNGDSDLQEQLGNLSDLSAGQFNYGNAAPQVITGTFNNLPVNIPATVPIRDVRSLNGILNNLTGGKYPLSITDTSSLTGLLGSVLNAASGLNLPSVFTSLLSSGKVDKNALYNAVNYALPQTTARGELGLFKDIASSAYAGQLKQNLPNIVSSVLTNVQKPYNLPRAQYPTYYGEMRTGLSNVDPQWNQRSRNGSYVLDSNAVCTNPFVTSMIKSNLVSQPMHVLPAVENVPGILIDVPNADISNPYIFDAIYGEDYDLDTRKSMVSDWSNNVSKRQARAANNDDAFLLTGSYFTGTSVEDQIGVEFPLLNVRDRVTLDLNGF